jgi:hypothetical protein
VAFSAFRLHAIHRKPRRNLAVSSSRSATLRLLGADADAVDPRLAALTQFATVPLATESHCAATYSGCPCSNTTLRHSKTPEVGCHDDALLADRLI